MSGAARYPVARDILALDPLILFLMSRARVALRLDVPCEHCGACVSEPCRTSSGRYLATAHAVRARYVRRD